MDYHVITSHLNCLTSCVYILQFINGQFSHGLEKDSMTPVLTELVFNAVDDNFSVILGADRLT